MADADDLPFQPFLPAGDDHALLLAKPLVSAFTSMPSGASNRSHGIRSMRTDRRTASVPWLRARSRVSSATCWCRAKIASRPSARIISSATSRPK